MDALTDVFQSVNMRGSVFSRASLHAPWGVESGTLETGIFHAVVRGRAWVQLTEGGEPIELERGDVVVIPGGDNHSMSDAPGRSLEPMVSATRVDAHGLGRLVIDGGGAPTSLICGTMTFDHSDAHPMFSLLPPMIVARDRAGDLSDVVDTIVGLIAAETDEPVPGSETVVARLTDVLLVYVLRRYIADAPLHATGWLGALRDPTLAAALAHIHRYPARPWTAEQLAAAVGTSRSSFFARFREVMGETPAEYMTRWRIHLATGLLRDEGCSVAAAGRRVGYRTEAAFSNAFLRVVGVRPGAYKRAA